jgi:hypothetical protein
MLQTTNAFPGYPCTGIMDDPISDDGRSQADAALAPQTLLANADMLAAH